MQNLLKQIVEFEKASGLLDQEILGFPFWRIVRFKTRTNILRIKTGFESDTTVKKLNIFEFLMSFFSSIYKILLVFVKNKSVQNLIFAFPRLQRIGNESIDKFTDPIILNSVIKKSHIVFQRPLARNHYKNRYNEKNTIKTDFIETFSIGFGLLLAPIFGLFYLPIIWTTFKKAKNYFKISNSFFLSYSISLGVFFMSFLIYYLLIKKLKPKRVFLVNRENFFSVILACKKQDIPVYELQHGVTHGPTVLYSGTYNKIADPDYFLVFGEAWIGSQFGIPIDKIINIGWGYKDFLKEYIKTEKFEDNVILVISSPEISAKIVEIVTNLAMTYSEYKFHIRLHPQERLTDEQLNVLKNYKNVSIQDNKTDSSIALMPYTFLLGENSTVLYDALSFGKKVGRLRFGGLNPEVLKDFEIDGFTYLDNIEDFKEFVRSETRKLKSSNLIYSDFNSEKVNNLQ